MRRLEPRSLPPGPSVSTCTAPPPAAGRADGKLGRDAAVEMKRGDGGTKLPVTLERQPAGPDSLANLTYWALRVPSGRKKEKDSARLPASRAVTAGCADGDVGNAVPVNVADRDGARAEEVETAQGTPALALTRASAATSAPPVCARLRSTRTAPRPIFAMSAHCAHGEVERTIAVRSPSTLTEVPKLAYGPRGSRSRRGAGMCSRAEATVTWPLKSLTSADAKGGGDGGEEYSHAPLANAARGSKFAARGSMQPTYTHGTPPSAVASGWKLSAAGSLHPRTGMTHEPSSTVAREVYAGDDESGQPRM